MGLGFDLRVARLDGMGFRRDERFKEREAEEVED